MESIITKIKLEVGKYYRTRDGNKIGPMSLDRDCLFMADLKNSFGKNKERIWYVENGRWIYSDAKKYIKGCFDGYDIVAEWNEEPMYNKKYRPWKDLTNEEKGALLLAHYEGKVVEFYDIDRWVNLIHIDVIWGDNDIYRIRPEPMKVKINLVYDPAEYCYDVSWDGPVPENLTLPDITFDLIDEKPDQISIRMEKV